MIVAMLAGCATAPSAPTRSGATSGAARALHLCPGGAISNAPRADSAGRMTSFTPHADIRGVRVARAPVKACLSSGFGPRRGGAGRMHKGVDLYTRAPAPIHAGGDGVIEQIGTMRGYGQTILIGHGKNVKTRYAHLSSYAPGLKRGARVREGEPIGRTGQTGNATAVHLHYEVIIDGKPVNPLTLPR